MRALIAFAATIAIAMLCSPAFAINCDRGVGMLVEVLNLCKQDASYCGDIPPYRDDANFDCGSKVVDKVLIKNGFAHLVDPEPEEPHFQPPDKLPRGCAYFTRPAVEADGARLNYHQQGARVCFQNVLYECVRTSNGGRKWSVAMENCDMQDFATYYDAHRLEGTAPE